MEDARSKGGVEILDVQEDLLVLDKVAKVLLELGAVKQKYKKLGPQVKPYVC